MNTDIIVVLDSLVILVSIVVLGAAAWSLFVKHKKVLWDVFFFGFICLYFGVGNMLGQLKVIPSNLAIFLPILMLIAIVIYGLIFVSRRTAASKDNKIKG